MKNYALALTITALAFGVISCGPAKRSPAGSPADRTGAPPDQLNEWVVLHLEPLADTGPGREDCKLMQKRPGPVQAVRGSWIRWILVGDCQAGVTVGISKKFTNQNGEDVNIIADNLKAENEADRMAGNKEIDLDGAQEEDPAREQIKVKFQKNRRLVVKIRRDAPYGTYRYQILINDKPLLANSLAERGVLRVCPEWPCSDSGRDE